MYPVFKALALAFAVACGGVALAQEGERPAVTVSGTGEIAVVPDMAVIEVGVSQQAEDASAALDATSTAVDRVLDRLGQAGVAERDIQTGVIRLDPVYADRTEPQQGPEVTGFVATNTLSVRLRDISAIGAILDAVVEDGANRLYGLRFDIADRAPLEDDARRAAVADALHKAALYADAAGLSLGAVQSIDETAIGGGPQPMMRESFAMSDSAAVPVARGEIIVSAQVRMVLELLPTE